jgi:hypothetical protein
VEDKLSVGNLHLLTLVLYFFECRKHLIDLQHASSVVSIWWSAIIACVSPSKAWRLSDLEK